jgi:hypothetical protein
MSATHNFLLVRQNSPIRWLLGAAAAVAAAAHLPVIQEHLEEAPYMGVLFVVLTGACFALALAALVHDTRAVYAASAVT